MPAAQRPLAVAHRGDPLGHRENTVGAVLAAARQGADAIDFVIQQTLAGVTGKFFDGRAIGRADPLAYDAAIRSELRERTKAIVRSVGGAKRRS